MLKCKLEEEEDIQGSFDFYALPGFEEVAPLLKKICHTSKMKRGY